MQAVKFPSFNKYKSQKVNWLHDKFDGHLAVIIKADVLTGVFTKNGNNVSDKYYAIKHIRETLAGLPQNTQVFAELHHPDKFATDVPTMLNAADPDLRLTAFAVPWLGGCDLRNYELNDAMDAIGQYMESSQPVKLTRQLTEEEVKELLDGATAQHLEGYVLKRSHMEGWYKLKPVEELDAFVTSAKTSTSASYFGLLKSVRAGVWKIKPDGSREVYDLGDVPGFKRAVIEEFCTEEKRAMLIDRVMKVEYSGIAGAGKMKGPHFAGWRTDNDKDDCTTEQFDNELD